MFTVDAGWSSSLRVVQKLSSSVKHHRIIIQLSRRNQSHPAPPNSGDAAAVLKFGHDAAVDDLLRFNLANVRGTASWSEAKGQEVVSRAVLQITPYELGPTVIPFQLPRALGGVGRGRSHSGKFCSGSGSFYNNPGDNLRPDRTPKRGRFQSR